MKKLGILESVTSKYCDKCSIWNESRKTYYSNGEVVTSQNSCMHNISSEEIKVLMGSVDIVNVAREILERELETKVSLEQTDK